MLPTSPTARRVALIVWVIGAVVGSIAVWWLSSYLEELTTLAATDRPAALALFRTRAVPALVVVVAVAVASGAIPNMRRLEPHAEMQVLRVAECLLDGEAATVQLRDLGRRARFERRRQVPRFLHSTSFQSNNRTDDRAVRGDARVLEHARATVDASNLPQIGMKDTGIRLQRGDRVSVTATGSIVMTPWGNNVTSSPDGAGMNVPFYANGIASGALIGRVGRTGEDFLVGSRNEFTAKTSGTLFLGVAMAHQFANQGYTFPGTYDVRIRVNPPAH